MNLLPNLRSLSLLQPGQEEDGIPNLHFHIMTTMCPLNPDGTWRKKQRREYIIDEDGNLIVSAKKLFYIMQ